MNPKINYFVDVILIVLVLIVAFSERSIHHIAGSLLILFIVIHIILHWKILWCWTKDLLKIK
jgi:hypothetical protein